MKKFFNKLAWYPPAETKIPFPAIIGAFFSQKCDLKEPLSEYLKVEHCVLGNSGRGLLYLLLKTLHQRHDPARNEVIIPGYTCYTVAASVAKADLKLRVYDLDPHALHPDLDSLKQAISENTLAVISQHLFGIPSPVNKINKIAKEEGAYLIEDAAQALGGSLDGIPLGTIGDFGLYSFGRGKPLPLGSGGALIGKDRRILEEIQFNHQKKGYAQLAFSAAVQILSKPQTYGVLEMLPLGLGQTIFDPDFDVASMPVAIKTLLKKAMPTLEGLNTHRQNISRVYEKAFGNDVVIPVSGEATPVYTRFPLMAGDGQIPVELKRLGIRRMYPKGITEEIKIKPFLEKQQMATPGASLISRNLITLPTHKRITEDRAEDIIRNVKKIFHI